MQAGPKSVVTARMATVPEFEIDRGPLAWLRLHAAGKKRMGTAMANKLAGQRAKFSRARAIFYSAGDDGQRRRAAELMAEVLAEAPANGFTEDAVTQGEDVPDEVRQLAAGMPARPPEAQEDQSFL